MLTLILVVAQSLAPPPPPMLPRGREQTPVFEARWSPPLEAEAALLRNPFAAEELIATARLSKAPIPSRAEVQLSNFLGVDVSAKGEVLRVWNVSIPGCDPEASRCEMFDVMARNVTKWDFKPAQKSGKKVSSRAILDLKMKIELRSVDVKTVRFAPLEPTALPPPAVTPLPSLDAILAERLALGAVTEVPPGFVPVESTDQIPLPPGRSFDIPNRALSVAGDLLVHVTATGTVDRVLALDVQPRLLWPFWQETVSSWQFEPARTAGGPVASWVRVSLDQGSLRLTGDVRQVSMIRRNLPLAPEHAKAN